MKSKNTKQTESARADSVQRLVRRIATELQSEGEALVIEAASQNLVTRNMAMATKTILVAVAMALERASDDSPNDLTERRGSATLENQKPYE